MCNCEEEILKKIMEKKDVFFSDGLVKFYSVDDDFKLVNVYKMPYKKRNVHHKETAYQKDFYENIVMKYCPFCGKKYEE